MFFTPHFLLEVLKLIDTTVLSNTLKNKILEINWDFFKVLTIKFLEHEKYYWQSHKLKIVLVIPMSEHLNRTRCLL